MRSGDTSSTCIAIELAVLAFLLLFLLFLFGQRLCLLPGAVGVADVEERLLRKVVEVAVDKLLERLDRLLDGHVDALDARKLCTHEEGLGQELLYLAGPLDDDLV